MKIAISIAFLALASAASETRRGRGGKKDDKAGSVSLPVYPAPTQFKIALWGDMPYVGTEVNVFDGDNGPKYAAVRDSMNSAGVEFSVHMGDVKGGSSPCGELNYKRFEDLAMSLTIPSFLTIGDNGWTDCHRLAAGNYDPLDRLSLMRSRFFNARGGTKLGGGSIKTLVQSNYPENQLFMYGGIVHAVVHVVGSNNALYDNIDFKCDKYLAVIDPACQAATAEHKARDAAVNKMINDAFIAAQENSAKGVMIYIQANMFGGPCGDPDVDPACAESSEGCGCCDIERSVKITTGFYNFWGNLVDKAGKFDGPIILVHGDYHYFQIYPNPNGDAENIVAVMVPGSSDIGWVEADIDTSGAKAQFKFTMIDNNPDYDHYADCPNSPNLALLNKVDAFP